MTAKVFAAAMLAAAAVAGLTGCATVGKTCTVRHRYAIVLFSKGAGIVGKAYVSRFRLNITYGPGIVSHTTIWSHIPLRQPGGNQLAVAIETYLVGSARSCSVDQVKVRP